MEVFLFAAIAVVVAALLLWRSRARTGGEPGDPTAGLPDDLRDKNTGQGSMPNRGRPWSGGN